MAQRALVTGAASGIGEAVAKCTADQGGRIVALDVDESGLERVCGDIEARGASATFRQLDIRRRDAVESTFSDFAAGHWRIIGETTLALCSRGSTCCRH